jgi:hypothetical protein
MRWLTSCDECEASTLSVKLAWALSVTLDAETLVSSAASLLAERMKQPWPFTATSTQPTGDADVITTA